MQIGWFEIPVTDMVRAKSFYDGVFGVNIQIKDFGVLSMGLIPNSEGALVYHPDYYISSETEGVLIYFTCDEVNVCLDRVSMAGGKILQESRLVSPEFGFMGLFVDSEGNRVALRGLSE